jgi:hypothetical protein
VFSKLIVQWVTLSYLVVPLFFIKITCLDVSGLKSYLSCCYKQRKDFLCPLCTILSTQDKQQNVLFYVFGIDASFVTTSLITFKHEKQVKHNLQRQCRIRY